MPTKVCLVKAMVFPVVMYGCESWTIKKAECPRIDAFELWCWGRLLRIPWTTRRYKESKGQGWDGWMTSPTQWTWVWISSGSWWWTGRLGMLQSVGWQRIRHDWVTELNWMADGFFTTSATWETLLIVQFSSVAQLCPTLFDPMNCSMPGLPVLHQLPQFTQTLVHWVGDAI